MVTIVCVNHLGVQLVRVSVSFKVCHEWLPRFPWLPPTQSARCRKSMEEVYVGQILKFHISLSSVAIPNWMGSWEKGNLTVGLKKGKMDFVGQLAASATHYLF